MEKNEITEEAADLLWKCREYAQRCGLGNAGQIIAVIEYFVHKHFQYDMQEHRFKLKETK